MERFFREIFDLLENQARSRRVSLDLQVDGGPVVRGAGDQLRQAFLNLAINSLESMPEGGSLHIFAGHGDCGRVQIRITDTGTGIAPEQLPRLFDPFYTTRHGGTGLGLTIVRRVILEHGGRIRVESTPGMGSTFHVELPPAAPAGMKETPIHA